MSDYWLGFVTPIIIAVLLWGALHILAWMLWWWTPESQRLGKGYHHVADYYDAEDGRWYPRSRHTHYWPSDTPWWLVRWAEPLRIWLCYRQRDHRPPTAKQS